MEKGKRTRPGISHGQKKWLFMMDLEVLVFKLLAIDGFASSSITGSEISALDHELLDHSVEDGACDGVS